MAGGESVTGREEFESFLAEEGRRRVAAFMADATDGGDDFDIDAVIAQNHADAMRDWFGEVRLPAREDLR